MTAKRLLIVDDEVDFGVSLRRVAEKLGFTVEVTTNGKEFKEVYKRFNPTAVILDMIMPEIDGTELVEWLASVQCMAPIIIVSGYTPLYAQTAINLGRAKGLLLISNLVKPVSLAALTAMLTSALLEAEASAP